MTVNAATLVRSIVVLLLMSAAAQVSGCGGSEKSETAIEGAVMTRSPSPFADDFDARMVSNSSDIWLAITGQADNGLSTLVYEFVGDQWVALPGATETAKGTPLLMAMSSDGSNAEPCVGVTLDAPGRTNSDTEPSISCFDGTRWIDAGISKSLKGMSLLGLETVGGDLTAMFSKSDLESSVVRIARFEGDQIVPVGPEKELPPQAVVVLGQTVQGGRRDVVDVGFEDLVNGVRSVASLEGGKWRMSERLAPLIPGPQVGGGVRNGNELFFPVNEAPRLGEDAFNWPFSVYQAADSSEPWSIVGEGPLNRGAGSAQGSLDAAGDEVWASWVQNVWNDYRAMPTKYFAARLNSGGEFDEPQVIWSGRTGGASRTQVERYRDGLAFLFMRQAPGQTVAHATVQFSTDPSSK